jgi:hypothetical protein
LIAGCCQQCPKMREFKNKVLGLVFIIFTLTGQAQSIKTVKDSLTNKPVPYVNIWVENEMIGTTSGENGEFHFSKSPSDKIIILSSIGYKTKKVQYKDNLTTIYLTPDVIQLKEIVITGDRKSSTTIIGDFKKSIVRHYFACSGYPYMTGKYFPYSESYAKTPYLGKIEVLTASDIKDAKFNIRLYTMNESGVPDILIFNENILCTAKKGTNLTAVDISDKLIEIPRTGVLVAIEFLIIESNRHLYEYTMVNQKEKLEGIRYEPKIGTIPAESGENSWQYNKGKWDRTTRATYSKLPEYRDKFTETSVKLTLTN